ncbi:hypothetical protein ACYPKM_05095 [Pseudomonas aeruginosa]
MNQTTTSAVLLLAALGALAGCEKPAPLVDHSWEFQQAKKAGLAIDHVVDSKQPLYFTMCEAGTGNLLLYTMLNRNSLKQLRSTGGGFALEKEPIIRILERRSPACLKASRQGFFGSSKSRPSVDE